MNLLEYMKKVSASGSESLAKRCSTTVGGLKQIAYGNRRAGPNMAINIDKGTEGEVSFQELRPDIDWSYVQSKKTGN